MSPVAGESDEELLRELEGENSHHIIEAAFKAFGRALRFACEKDARVTGVPSTKGVLA